MKRKSRRPIRQYRSEDDVFAGRIGAVLILGSVAILAVMIGAMAGII